ncbi:MAG: prepilin-type N-terminal cleavage/methylation domain-containing protein [Actinobacteria bacterium]|nr:prepilin-type N-terminal cleavage/methylation domain-containing protein [Actinomycetota bacterium]
MTHIRFRNRRDDGSQAGFTLIEVMVASLLLLIVLAGFLPFFLSGLEKSSASRFKSAATNVARQKLEEIRQLDYREIKENTASPTDPTNLSNLLGTTAVMRGNTYNIAYSVANSTSGGGQLKKVIVTVSWIGKPEGDPAVISTLIHQQFLGPRGSLLEFTPAINLTPDPLGSPFPVVSGTIVAKYHIARSDWDLVYKNLNQVGMAAKNVYLRLDFVDDQGARIQLGNPALEYRIPSSTLKHTFGGDGKVNDIWFEHNFDSATIPDGYWDVEALAYNEYDQPGNVYKMRVRLEKAAPNAVASFMGQVADNQTILLSWVPGAERDRVSWVLERRKRDTAGTWSTPWVTVTTLLGTANTYTDVGSTATLKDPWGTTGTTNTYQYSLKGIDIAGKVGTPVTLQQQLPAAATVSTTTTTSGGTTTSTAALYSVKIKNSSPKPFNLTVKNASSVTVYTGQVAKNGGIVTISNLPPGNYAVTAVEVTNKSPRTLYTTFQLPAQAGLQVWDIF